MAELRKRDLKERLLFHSGEAILFLAALFIVITIASSLLAGNAMATRELKVLKALRAIHAAEGRALKDNQHFRFISELPERGEAPLKNLERVDVPRKEGADQIGSPELFESNDYYFALYLADPARGDDRSWSRAEAGTSDVGANGYGVFAWPKHYSEGSQFAFYIDHRGRLLGNWNLNELFDGLNDPFPPPTHPLREFMAAQKSGDDCAWLEFEHEDELLGVTPETPSKTPAKSPAKSK